MQFQNFFVLYGFLTISAVTGAEPYQSDVMRRNPVAAVLMRCQFYLEQGNPVAAERECEQARQQGAAPGAVLPLLGRALLAQGDISGFFARIKPPNPLATRLRGMLALLYGQAYLMQKELNGARMSFNDALRVEEFSGAAHIGLAWVALEQGDLERAAQEIEPALARNADPKEIGMVQAEIFRRRAQPAAARDAFAQVLARDPRNLNARVGKAAMELALGESDPARVDLALVSAAAPNHPLVKRLQGLLNQDASGLVAQIYTFDRNLSSSADLLPLAQSLAQMVMAGHLQAALLAARRIQEWMPHVALGYATEGSIRMLQGDWSGAARFLGAAHQREPLLKINE